MNTMFFLLRRLGTRIFFPVALFSISLICCCTLLFHHKAGKKCYRAGRIFMISLVGIWFFVSYTGSFWLKLWTQQYLPINLETLPAEGHYVIAVPGHEFIPDQRFPPELRFSGPMLLRLGEAARIARYMNQQRMDYEILVSSYVKEEQKAEVRQAIRTYFQRAGLAVPELSFVNDAWNSRQEVRRFLTKKGRLILVSNSFHIPRLMMLADKYGSGALAAPADSLNYTRGPALFSNFYPDSRNIDSFERLVYELMGCAEVKFF